MGTYREEIFTPYGPDEAALRVNKWLQEEGGKYRVLEKGPDRVRLKRGMLMNPDIYFQLRFTDESVRAECWTEGITKDPISSDAVWGAISRRTGWNDFQKLKTILSEGVVPGSL